jgi:lincosamide nucleotidyltransferase
MPSPVQLLTRLDAIAASLRHQPDALALLALGSVGLETSRLDEHSDLDFFVIVAPGAKPKYLGSLSWLEQAHPVTFSFPNTPDGRKALFEDGIFAEYAVFEQRELQQIPYSSGRVVWQRGDATDIPAVSGTPLPPQTHSQEWQTNEALTNLLVGLRREARGERLSATRFIQTYAVDRVLALVALQRRAEPGDPDLFMPERRFERRFPSVADLLPGMMQGYEHNRASALYILAWLEEHATVHPHLAQEIRLLCVQAVP